MILIVQRALWKIFVLIKIGIIIFFILAIIVTIPNLIGAVIAKSGIATKFVTGYPGAKCSAAMAIPDGFIQAITTQVFDRLAIRFRCIRVGAFYYQVFLEAVFALGALYLFSFRRLRDDVWFHGCLIFCSQNGQLVSGFTCFDGMSISSDSYAASNNSAPDFILQPRSKCLGSVSSSPQL